jgi:hypothetical protein
MGAVVGITTVTGMPSSLPRRTTLHYLHTLTSLQDLHRPLRTGLTLLRLLIAAAAALSCGRQIILKRCQNISTIRRVILHRRGVSLSTSRHPETAAVTRLPRP